MEDCECGAHWMQSCSWWCGKGLTSKQIREIREMENPELAEIKRLRNDIEELKVLIKEKDEL